MRALIQRVTRAHVEVDGRAVAAIGRGLLVLLGVQRTDSEAQARTMAARLLAYRVFPDAEGRMNLDVRAVAGGVLLVPQFTLAADTSRGLRPGFSSAAEPGQAQALCEELLAGLRAAHSPVEYGVFGANMQVALVNDGPVSFLLET